MMHVLRTAVPASLRPSLGALQERMLIRSLRAALREQGLSDLYERLARSGPDIRHQYTMHEVATEYAETKVRAQHAFQMFMADKALQRVRRPSGQPLTVVDIGDSAGTHIQYLQALHPTLQLRCLSVNLDPQAVAKIQAKGMEAVCMRAEELSKAGIDANLFLSFETVEHLMDPIRFLRDLSHVSHCEALVLTVPYVAQSRLGLHHIRAARREAVAPENTHIFELSPGDWRLAFQHAGWAVAYDRIYLQYPRRGPLRLLKPWWKRVDFEGFWGAVLMRDATWSHLYQGW